MAGGGAVRDGFALGGWARRVEERLERWERERFAPRLWRKDPSLWAAEPFPPELADRLGWLDLPSAAAAGLPDLERLAGEVAAEGIAHAVVLGMGGSSLAPEVFARTFGPPGNPSGHPDVRVLDSTHPDAVRGLAAGIDPARSLFLVSSKSGGTTETMSFFRFFWDLLSRQGAGDPGRHFVAITDPGSSLEALARERGFRRTVAAPPDVGGRYSAFTAFGLVPAALQGMDVAALLARGREMAELCGPGAPAAGNPGLALGAALGELALAGRDKLTLFTSPSIAAFPDWLEQLIAESTGKEGKGIVPVAGEPLGQAGGMRNAPGQAGSMRHAPGQAGDIRHAPGQAGDIRNAPGQAGAYGPGRVFAALLVEGDENAGLEGRLAELEAAGHPVVRLALRDSLDLGREIFRWEVAVAAAGAVLGINPFDQPDVQLAKDLAKKAMAQQQAGEAEGGRAPKGNEAGSGNEGGVGNGGNGGNEGNEGNEGNAGSGGGDEVGASSGEALRRAAAGWLAGAAPPAYLGLQAYLAPGPAAEAALRRLQGALRDRTGCAVTAGWGPRFLHSTGQLHKGGPPGGGFLQIVDRPRQDLPVPETDYTFGTLIRAQAAGDREALTARGRTVLTVDLEEDPEAGLARLEEALRG